MTLIAWLMWLAFVIAISAYAWRTFTEPEED